MRNLFVAVAVFASFAGAYHLLQIGQYVDMPLYISLGASSIAIGVLGAEWASLKNEKEGK